MTVESDKSAIRSVDSVANIYAIVIGLALTQAIVTLVGKSGDGGGKSGCFENSSRNAGFRGSACDIATVLAWNEQTP